VRAVARLDEVDVFGGRKEGHAGRVWEGRV
jgi:hypothetical protein